MPTPFTPKIITDIPLSPFKLLLKANNKYLGWCFLSLLVYAIGTSLNAFTPYALKLLIDGISNINTFDVWKIVIISLPYFSFYVTSMIFMRIVGVTGNFWNHNIESTVLDSLTQYTLRHSHKFFQDNFAGNISKKMGNISDGIDTIHCELYFTFFGLIIALISSFIILSTININICYLIIAWLILYMIVVMIFRKKRIALSENVASASSNLYGYLTDIITNMSVVRYFAKQDSESKFIRKYLLKYRTAGIKSWMFNDIVLLILGILTTIICFLIILYGIYLFTQKGITLGDVVMIITSLIYLNEQIFYLGKSINNFFKGYGQAKEGLELIMGKHDIVDKENASDLKVKNGEIVFKNLNFGYGKFQVFKSFNLKINAGEKIGIVGVSGAGKSTLVGLLLRNFDINKGQILIDHQNIQDVTQMSLRKNIAYVPQDPSLFHRSIKDNIIYGNKSVSNKDLINIAKKSLVHEFVERLPQKYLTLVGERGVKLSGGQRQRVAIARAMISKSSIVVLDEATSSLDSESENFVQQAIKELIKKKTVIAIAHRLSTLLSMDRIVVLSKGKIVEDGTHKELIARNGIYAGLWKNQSEGYMKE